jgi:hypothetical protein
MRVFGGSAQNPASVLDHEIALNEAEIARLRQDL